MRLFAALVAALTVCAIARAQAVPVFWQRVAQCETGSQWHQRGQRFVGGLGIEAGNYRRWSHALGLTRPAWQAPPAEQVRVALYGRRVDHATWGCFRVVGWPQ